MSQIKLKALRNHPFGTGVRETGEEYSATRAEAATLVALGWAEAVTEEDPAKTSAKTAALKADKPAGGYKTRDIKAGK